VKALDIEHGGLCHWKVVRSFHLQAQYFYLLAQSNQFQQFSDNQWILKRNAYELSNSHSSYHQGRNDHKILRHIKKI
jgi:hypothetical protein